MITLHDGSLRFEAGEAIPLLPYYFQDVNDPLHFIPKFKECQQRCYEVYKTKCGRTTGRFKCLLDEETVSVPSCNKCSKNSVLPAQS